jgi:hypothetical protein
MAKHRNPRTPAPLTKRQRSTVYRLNSEAWAVRGVQMFVVGLGAYLAICKGRGWPALIIACLLALYFNAYLPALPLWLEERRPSDDD